MSTNFTEPSFQESASKSNNIKGLAHQGARSLPLSRSEMSSIENRSEMSSIENRSEMSSIEKRSKMSSIENRSKMSSSENRSEMSSINNLFNPLDVSSVSLIKLKKGLKTKFS